MFTPTLNSVHGVPTILTITLRIGSQAASYTSTSRGTRILASNTSFTAEEAREDVQPFF